MRHPLAASQASNCPALHTVFSTGAAGTMMADASVASSMATAIAIGAGTGIAVGAGGADVILTGVSATAIEHPRTASSLAFAWELHPRRPSSIF